MSKITIVLIGDISYDGRVLKEIGSLKRLGHEITLIFSVSSKPLEELNLGIKCILISNKKGSNLLQKIFFNLNFYRKVHRYLKRNKPDYIHCNDFNTFVVSFRRIKGVKYVYDAHELTFGTTSFFKEFVLNTLEYYLIKKAYSVIIPQIDRLNLVRMKFQIDPSKLFLLENFPVKGGVYDGNFFETEYGFLPNGKTILSYSGLIDDKRCIKELILSMKQIDNAVLFLIGSPKELYKKEILALIKSNNLENIVYVKPSVDNYKVMYIASSSDIGICFYQPNRFNNYFSASNKLYDYLSVGTKVLSNATPSTLRVCDQSNSYLIDVITIASISNAVNKLQLIPQPTPSNFYWSSQEDVLESIYNKQ